MNGNGNGSGNGGGKRWILIGGAVLLGIAVVNNAYEAGLRAGLAAGGRGPIGDIDGWGYIPFPPLPLILLGLLAFWAYRRGAFGTPRRDRGSQNGHGHGHGLDQYGRGRGFGSGQPPQFVIDWHRRLHEAERQQAARTGAGSAAPTGQPPRPAEPAPTGGTGSGGPTTL